MRRWLTSPTPLAIITVVAAVDGVAALVLGPWPVAIGSWCCALACGLILSARSSYLTQGRLQGWHEARDQMYSSLHEAMRRGMSPVEWMQKEMERDFGEALFTLPRRRRNGDGSRNDGGGGRRR